ncbi:MAG: hypothetical protein ACRDVG_06360 [Jatrophihabitantaceae bacterium]
MYLACYRYDGDPDDLEAKYRTLLAPFAADIAVQLAVRRRDGLDVYDSCPSEQQFRDFSTSAAFRTVQADAGLPEPRVEGLGEVVHVIAKDRVG